MNDPAQTPIRCGARTRSGAPCAKFPVEGKRRCRLHGGLSTGPKTAAGRAAISAANTKRGRYKNWREKQAKELTNISKEVTVHYAALNSKEVRQVVKNL